MRPVIQAEGLTHFYGDLKALDNISFEIPENKITGLLGPNGAGKTTLINILCTLLKPTRGDVKVFGYDVVKEAKKIRPYLTLVPQTNATLDPNLSVIDNLRFFSLLNQQGSKKDVLEVADAFGLTEVKNLYTFQLSGGMLRKLILARLAMDDSKLIFLDEPTVGIDVYGKAAFGEFIRSLKDEMNASVVITTHDLAEAEILCDQMIILHEGKIRENISTDLIKSQYFKKITVSFIGSIRMELIHRITAIAPDTVTVYAEDMLGFFLRERLPGYIDFITELSKAGQIDNIAIEDVSLEDYFKNVIQGNERGA